MRDTFSTRLRMGTAVALVAGLMSGQAQAEPLARPSPAAGSVIDRKTGEEVRFVDLSDWRGVEVQQALLGGDVLRTNAVGQLAILFADHTQVRLGRNSALQVKQMGTSEDTVLNLQSGTMWARAQRGGQGLTVETPAAAAAIRGTDWTLTVKGDQTSLIVLEGKIEFKNAYGSVEVREGEAAVASIGQAPRKLVIVRPKDRQQMLFYLTLRSGFTIMPASPLPVDRMRAERQRIGAMPPASRSTADWLTLAETQMALDSQADVEASLVQIRQRRLTPSEHARLDLMEALIAGSARRYGDAARLFARSERNLDPKRRAIAAYGGYFSRSLLDPERVERPPATVAAPYAEVMRAFTQGFLQDIPAAIEVVRKAEARFPGDSSLPAVRALLHALTGEPEEMRKAVDRALALDPQNPTAIEARGLLKADYLSDRKGAIADFEEAIRLSPGSSSAWNNLGLVYEDKGAAREAEAAFLKAIALDPDDPVGHANLAILYLDQSRMREAKAEIDRALAVDPAFDVALVARGRYYLQSGENDKALEDLLAGSTANPSYSQAQLLLGAGYYMQGERDPSNQALDNADRLDKNDPVVSSFRTALAIDDYDAEGAIRNAQDFLRRSRAQGGDYSSLSANQDAGSTLNNAFRLQGLDAWGRYYGDAVFDPFSGSAYVDQAVHGQANPYVNSYLYGDNTVANDESSEGFSSLFQGLLLDPHMLAGRSRSATILRAPFLDTEIGAGLFAIDGETRRAGEAQVQGFSNLPVPMSFLGNITWSEIPSSGSYDGFGGYDADTEILQGSGYLTASLTPTDRLVIYGNHNRTRFGLDSLALSTDLGIPLPLTRTRDDDNDVTNGGIGWSHTFADRNVLNAAVLYNGIDSQADRYFEYDVFGTRLPIGRQIDTARQRTYVGAVSHAIGWENFTLRYGAEGGWIDTTQRSVLENLLFGGPPVESEASSRTSLARAYVDVLQEFTPDLKAEYALFANALDGDTVDETRLEPRIGVAWSPVENHWLRAGFMRQGFDTTTPTLSPVGILGLQPASFNLAGGYADTAAFEWDAEWTSRFFTAVEYQHQELHDFQIGFPLTALPLADSFTLSRGSIDRASLTTNTILGGGFGLSTTIAVATSENGDASSANFGGSLPYVPETAGQVALTYVSDINLKATLAANYTGRRDGDERGRELDDFWTVDASLIWEPLDKRMSLEASAYNLLDEDFELAPSVPGWGRGFKGMLKVRF